MTGWLDTHPGEAIALLVVAYWLTWALAATPALSAMPSAENDAPDCRCPKPTRPTGREAEPLPPWKCLTCGGYACEYADPGKTRCSPSICDCFITMYPDSPRDLHPEAFIVGPIPPEETKP